MINLHDSRPTVPVASARKKVISPEMIFAYLVTFFSFANIAMGGDLFISELLLFVYLVFSFNKFRHLSEPLPRKILLFGILWLLSQIVTDVIRDTPSENYLRGWAAIIIFLVDFSAVYLIIAKNVIRARMIVFAYALGLIFQFIVVPTEFGAFEPWKWALALPITLLLLLYLEVRKTRAILMLMVLVLLGLVDVYLNARSMGGITIISGLIIYLSRRATFRMMFRRQLNLGKMAVLAVVGIGGVGLILMTYQWAAESGFLPEDVTQKYEMDKSSKFGLFGLILGGRGEIVVSAQAVMDSPIIGHGSWAEDRKYALMLLEVSKIFGLDREEAQPGTGVVQSDLIPAHSHIMQAWVWAGLLGAIFWFVVLKFIFSALLSIMRYPNVLQPITVFFCIGAIWDILFSPFGSIMRFLWALKLVVIWLAKEEAERAAHTVVAKI